MFPLPDHFVVFNNTHGHLHLVLRSKYTNALVRGLL